MACRVCAHPERAALDAVLGGKANITHLSLQLGISRQMLMRHRDGHIVRTRTMPENPPRQQRFAANRSTIPEPADAPRNAPPPPADTPPEPPDRQELFLASYAASGDLKRALKAAGVTRAQLRQWQEHDEPFSLRFYQAETEAIEALEAEARVRALAGSPTIRRIFNGDGALIQEIHTWAPSDTMLVRLLQAHKPEKYGDKLSVTQTTVVKAVDKEAWDAV
jgi:hypothetical protein